MRNNLIERLGYKSPRRKLKIHERFRRARKFAAMLAQGGEGAKDMRLNEEKEVP